MSDRELKQQQVIPGYKVPPQPSAAEKPVSPPVEEQWLKAPVVCKRCGLPIKETDFKRRFLECSACHARYVARFRGASHYQIREFSEVVNQMTGREKFLEADSRLRHYLPNDLHESRMKVRSSRQILQNQRLECDRMEADGRQRQSTLLGFAFGGVFVTMLLLLLGIANVGGLILGWLVLGLGVGLLTIVIFQYRRYIDAQVESRVDKKKEWMLQAYHVYLSHLSELKDLELEEKFCRIITSNHRIRFE